ncbi:pyrimidine-nucleoside phosphorylase [Latilactobacillus curvatus]|uniref:pyrimidine-nucleoside phosphorylase n=1 Tax=Latilactobacillus curvatus TaxID=28038 RepID=UPI0009754DB6|nr:pyrimidine-nucleoside phosphorylase [Latilactobacillus curvatus]ASN61776.1 pyrimidine-nucleoside phosphorylase [Latilactobacillus curvatus]MCT1216548.1 pyrimidine-nucleoside phosphorylase [Latilactobacillus curvatus]MCT2880015.1 pyrimidine-nucleoside phosphorylase [Latilactobacillus curvatus]MCT3525412.1 pyrimidine-nucleoside phosphorylase [Latilactobacillus curvatus]UTB70300.1 pyrimidine-nucleoside phosphorylase [Latilactobacillus curvatus]
MRMVDIIDHKRQGGALTAEEIQFFIDGYTDGTIPDYQASALLMAIYFNDMTDDERALLTMTMMRSGDQLDLSMIDGIKVDKHSTGGVGDKTSIPLAPMIAALGIPIPMISGRGLGHTGGTLDKLEAIPNFNISLTEEAFKKQVAEIKLAIIGATGNIAPADKKIYALRDVTDTVDSIPLIAGSIMSKKIASGTDTLVLDVKTGSGAFMKTEEDAKELAQALVNIGRSVGMQCMAVISDMNQPLGNTIGNALEIEESIAILKGEGPTDITELILTLGSQMVVLAGKATTLDEARQLLQGVIDDGRALEAFRKMIIYQGGDPAVIENPKLMPQAQYQIELPAKENGYVTEMTANEMGIASMLLGGGRQAKTDEIDYAVGLVLHKKIGDPVQKGESLLTIYSNREDIEAIKDLLYDNIKIGPKAQKVTLIHALIQ